MALVLKEMRKVAVVGWDPEVVDGKTVSIQVEGEEKRTVDNDGESNLFFPTDFTGDRIVTVAGIRGTEEVGTISVP